MFEYKAWENLGTKSSVQNLSLFLLFWQKHDHLFRSGPGLFQLMRMSRRNGTRRMLSGLTLSQILGEMRCMLVQLAITYDGQLDQHAPHSTVSACAMSLCERSIAVFHVCCEHPLWSVLDIGCDMAVWQHLYQINQWEKWKLTQNDCDHALTMSSLVPTCLIIRVYTGSNHGRRKLGPAWSN